MLARLEAIGGHFVDEAFVEGGESFGEFGGVAVDADGVLPGDCAAAGALGVFEDVVLEE